MIHKAKAEVFNLGIILLEVGTLLPMKPLYTGYNFDYSYLNKCLDTFKQLFGEFLGNLVTKMVLG